MQDSQTPRHFAIEGDMTIYRAADLKAELLAMLDAAAAIDLDLSAVAALDSAGFQVLYLAKREAAARGGALRIVAHSAAVREVLDSYGMATYFGDPLFIAADEPG